LAAAKDFAVLQNIQTRCVAYRAFYSVGTAVPTLWYSNQDVMLTTHLSNAKATKEWSSTSTPLCLPSWHGQGQLNTLRTGIFFLYINHKSLIQSKVTFF
jgi:hypothetical protein